MQARAEKRLAKALTAFTVVAACVLGIAGFAGQAHAASGMGAGTRTGTAAISASNASPELKPLVDGWEFDGNAWHYWQGGSKVTSRWIDTAAGPQISGAAAGAHRYWVDADGNLAVSRLVNVKSSKDKLAGYYAYATEFGYIATSKTTVGSKIYLVKADSKNLGELESGNKKAGRLRTAKYSSDSKRHYYYIDKKAHAVITGKSVKIKGYGWVYNYPDKGYALTGIKKFDKTHLVLSDKYGRLCRQKKGLWKSDAYYGAMHWYYIEKTKANKKVYGARIGRFKAKGKQYIGLKKGYLFTDAYKIVNGKYYRADERGAIAYDSVVNGLIKKAAGYSSPSRYLLMVDIDNPRTMVFEGYRGHWKVKYIWKCCTGRPSNPTITGRFSIGAKGHSFGESHGYACYYWSEISGDYLFHSRKYYPYTHKLMDGRIGKRCSLGCVRLYDKNAIWIQRNCPAGTTVVCTR